MPQSLSAVYIHLIFSTKNRHPWIQDAEGRERLHAYLGGVSKTLECPPRTIGGVEDHLHVLAQLGRSISQADWVKELKRVSSIWFKDEAGGNQAFAWQSGYACFSVSASNLDVVEQYIANQESHHRQMSFQDEVRALLKKHQVEWDERYIWD